MQRRQVNLVREYHHLVVSCRDESTYTFGRSRRYQTGQHKFIRCNSVFASRKHFEVFADVNGVWKVRDLNSTNGTFVNRTQLVFGEAKILRDGDKIGMGIVGIPPYNHLIDCSDERYYIFKVVISENCDLENRAPVQTFPFQAVRVLCRSNGQNPQLVEAIRNAGRMYRSHRQHMRRKQAPITPSIPSISTVKGIRSVRVRRVRRLIILHRKAPSGTPALTEKILRRWFVTINKGDKAFRRKLIKAVKKLWRWQKTVLFRKCT